MPVGWVSMTIPSPAVATASLNRFICPPSEARRTTTRQDASTWVTSSAAHHCRTREEGPKVTSGHDTLPDLGLSAPPLQREAIGITSEQTWNGARICGGHGWLTVVRPTALMVSGQGAPGLPGAPPRTAPEDQVQAAAGGGAGRVVVDRAAGSGGGRPGRRARPGGRDGGGRGRDGRRQGGGQPGQHAGEAADGAVGSHGGLLFWLGLGRSGGGGVCAWRRGARAAGGGAGA